MVLGPSPPLSAAAEPRDGGILKLLRSSGINSTELVRLAYVAWRAGTTTLFLLGSYSLQIVLKFQHRLHRLVELIHGLLKGAQV